MTALARNELIAGLILHCNDERCGRQAWRDFRDYSANLTLRQLHRRARCDCCGSLAGFGVSVELLHAAFSTPHPSPHMVEAEHRRLRAHRDYIHQHPFAWRRVAGCWSQHRPDPALLD